MIKANTFKGRTVAVFGLGRTGVTAALSLVAGGADVWAWDDNETAREAAAAQGVPLKDLKSVAWEDVDDFVLSPGVPHHLPEPHWSAKLAQAAGVPIICDIEIFAREMASCAEGQRPKLIAITGTNGKSTTTSLIGHVLKACGKDAAIGGNIGRGVLDLPSLHKEAYYVVELSSYQLERAPSLRANVAIFLNLSADHLDRHGDLESYGAAKRAVFANQTKNDSVIVGVDDAYGKKLCTELKVKNGRSVVPVSAHRSLGYGVSVLGGKLFTNLSRKTYEVCDLSQAEALEGHHNWQNAAAAFAAVSALGVDSAEAGRAILSFPGLAHRMETVGVIGKVRFVNDSKATNADAARQALKSYETIFWIAGGVAKAEGIAPLSDLFPRVEKAYLIGEAAPDFEQSLKAKSISCEICPDLNKAVIRATKDALMSDAAEPIILLSPACASFDQFKNFEVRGEAFRTQVNAIMALQDEAKGQDKTEGQDKTKGSAA